MREQILEALKPIYKNQLTDENLNEFFLELSTVVPMMILEQITEEEQDMLGFNHQMNILIMQYYLNLKSDSITAVLTDDNQRT